MLRRFLYLHEKALNEYLGALDGGISDQVSTRQRTQGSRGANISGGVEIARVGASLSRDREEESTRTIRQTPEQRFDRLLQLLDLDPERHGYEEVLDLDDAFPRLTVGSFISVDCDIDVPESVRTLAQPDQLESFFSLAETYRSLAPMIGEKPDGLPSKQELTAYQEIARAISSDLVVVGETAQDSPHIVGRLHAEYVRDFPEGEARVVGKVARKWTREDTYPLLALPGASLLSREQRRKMTLSREEDSLRGPALSLDVLAIYR